MHLSDGWQKIQNFRKYREKKTIGEERMENSRTVKKGDYILIDYTVKFEDGTVFDTTVKEKAIEAGIYDEEKKYRPFFFRTDARQVIKGIDAGVLGMREGEEKPSKSNLKKLMENIKTILFRKFLF
ncbi:MAG: FKBP-type peptidyl-prolyl cis-trans isomerase [Methanosarcina sp.]|nr:FKBP-type peptidyl-prolyl cis-trans isomerase [Methanosarcina sp.]